ncbi:MAG: hypothetical protein AAGA56_19270 [Myxococcota bacterium]
MAEHDGEFVLVGNGGDRGAPDDDLRLLTGEPRSDQRQQHAHAQAAPFKSTRRLREVRRAEGI